MPTAAIREVSLRDGLQSVPTTVRPGRLERLITMRSRAAGWPGGTALHGALRRARLPKTMREATNG